MLERFVKADHLAALPHDVPRLAVREIGSEIAVAQYDHNADRVPVHHRFFVGTEPYAQHSQPIIFVLHSVVFRIKPHGIPALKMRLRLSHKLPPSIRLGRLSRMTCLTLRPSNR